jgi:hypothetical protein
LNLRVNLTQQRNRKRYKGKPRAHLSFILDYYAFFYWALEHTVLRVLRIQTLENNSVVKDLPILFQAWSRGCNTPPTPFYNIHRFHHSSRRAAGHTLEGFQQGGTSFLGEEFDPEV